MKSLIPKGAKSVFDQNRVTYTTILFSLLPTFRTSFYIDIVDPMHHVLIQIILVLILGYSSQICICYDVENVIYLLATFKITSLLWNN